uniref:Undecaprenyl-diphosphatase n=1 Tax=candidate division CPR3 bacterium TaxID=2268181 RepID=A0A7C5YXS1_UNCC3
MTFFEGFILAVLQGLTEFLPISSSGHLVLAQVLFGIKEPTLSYDLFLHFGTQIAVILYFWPRLKRLFSLLFSKKNSNENLIKRWKDVLIPIFFVTLPVVLVGIFVAERVEKIFYTAKYLPFTYLFTAILLLTTKFVKLKSLKLKWVGLSLLKSLFIGIFQAVSTLPGISRSGATIAGGLYVGLKPKDAFEFSFFAGLISITGSFIFEILKNGNIIFFDVFQIVNTFVAAICGYLVLRLLGNLIKSGKLWIFSIYCFVMCITSLMVWLKL